MSSPSVDSTIADGKNLLHGLCFHQHAAFDQQIVLCSLHLLLLETADSTFFADRLGLFDPGIDRLVRHVRVFAGEGDDHLVDLKRRINPARESGEGRRMDGSI